MAKYDQRILKYLTQNSDKAPTITEMMTRLNISISEISESLASLLEQRLVAKRTNIHGIECWYPTPATSQAPSTSQIFDEPTSLSPVYSAPTLQMDTRAFGTLSGLGGNPIESNPEPRADERLTPIPQVKSQPLKPVPVAVQHIQPSERPRQQTQSFPALATPPPTGTFATTASLTKPTAKGVSLLTFAIGLVLTLIISIWISSLLMDKEIKAISKSMADQKAMAKVSNPSQDFQAKTKSRIQGLQEQINSLKDQLAQQSAANQIQAIDAEPSPKEVAPPSLKPSEPAKSKVTKKTKASKPVKTNKIAKTVKASKPSSALTKNSALKSTPKKAMPVEPKVEPIENVHSGNEAASANSANDDLPTVPQAPGINDQDLPPPPDQ